MIKISKTEPFRSHHRVNMSYNMVRVTLDMPTATWRLLQKLMMETHYFEVEDTATEGDYEGDGQAPGNSYE